jgi:hypothetical protein
VPINVTIRGGGAPSPGLPPINNYKGLCMYTGSDFPTAVSLTGIKHARSDWPSASFVTAAKAAGVQVLPIACYAHGHGTAPDGSSHIFPTGANLTAWLSDLTTDLVGAWQSPPAVEIWNEPWHVQFAQPTPDPTAYLSLCISAANAIWAVRPTTIILVSADTTGSTNTSGTIYWRQNLIAADTTGFLTDPRVRPSTHNYSEDRPPTLVTSQPSWWDFPRYNYAYNDFVAHGHHDPQVWVTEWGWEVRHRWLMGGGSAFPTGGTFTLTLTNPGATATQTTAPIIYNATSAEIAAALDNLSMVAAGQSSITGGPLPNTQIDIQFGGNLSPPSTLTLDTSGLTGSVYSLTQVEGFNYFGAVREISQSDFTVQGLQMMQASARVERAYCFFYQSTNSWSYNWLNPSNQPRAVCAAVKGLI